MHDSYDSIIHTWCVHGNEVTPSHLENLGPHRGSINVSRISYVRPVLTEHA